MKAPKRKQVALAVAQAVAGVDLYSANAPVELPMRRLLRPNGQQERMRRVVGGWAGKPLTKHDAIDAMNTAVMATQKVEP